MYRNNSRDCRNMVRADRLISKRVAKALHFRKVLENEVLRFPKSGSSVKMCFGFWASFGLEWSKKALFKENRKKKREWKLGVTQI